MKKLLAIAAVASGVLGLSGPLHAQIVYPPNPTVGVQFTPYYSNPYSAMNNTCVQGYIPNPAGYQGGAVNQEYWNMANNSTGGGDGAPTTDITNSSLLDDSNGTYSNAGTTVYDSNDSATTVTFDLSGATQNRGSAGGGSGFTITGGGNAYQWYEANGATPSQLVSGVEASTSSSAPVTLTLSGLNAGDNYEYLVYVGSLNYYGGGVSAAVNLGSLTYYLLTDGGTLTNYTLSTATSAITSGTADYVEYTGLGSALNGQTLTVTGAGTGISAFQLVDLGAATVPEPASLFSLGIGILGMAAFRIRRRRIARA